MSDFLTHLVQRTLSPTAEVRPSLPSRFGAMPAQAEENAQAGRAAELGGQAVPPRQRSTPPPATGTLRAGEQVLEALAPPGATRPQAPPPPAMPADPATLSAPAGRSDPPDRPRPNSPASKPAPGDASRPQTASKSVEPSQTLRPVTPALSSLETRDGRQPRGEGNANGFIGERATVLSPPEEERRDEGTEAVPKEASGNALNPSSSLKAPVGAPAPDNAAPANAPRRPIEIRATKATPPPATSLSSRTLHQTPARPESAAPPPIHVTIGRVEVRALPAAVPAPPAPSPTPKLGLGEFLETRKGARR